MDNASKLTLSPVTHFSTPAKHLVQKRGANNGTLERYNILETHVRNYFPWRDFLATLSTMQQHFLFCRRTKKKKNANSKWKTTTKIGITRDELAGTQKYFFARSSLTVLRWHLTDHHIQLVSYRLCTCRSCRRSILGSRTLTTKTSLTHCKTACNCCEQLLIQKRSNNSRRDESLARAPLSHFSVLVPFCGKSRITHFSDSRALRAWDFALNIVTAWASWKRTVRNFVQPLPYQFKLCLEAVISGAVQAKQFYCFASPTPEAERSKSRVINLIRKLDPTLSPVQLQDHLCLDVPISSTVKTMLPTLVIPDGIEPNNPWCMLISIRKQKTQNNAANFSQTGSPLLTCLCVSWKSTDWCLWTNRTPPVVPIQHKQELSLLWNFQQFNCAASYSPAAKNLPSLKAGY